MSLEPLDPAVLDRHPDGVMRLRSVRSTNGQIRDFSCTYANVAAASLLARSDLVGKALTRELPALDDAGLIHSLAETVRSGEPCKRPLVSRPPSSGPSLEVTALKDGDGLLLFLARRGADDGVLPGVCADITERQRLERQLRESEERFQQFMSNCPASAYIKDADGRFIFVNSMSDLFHERSPLAYIQKVFAVMREAKQHQFQVLTKRAEPPVPTSAETSFLSKSV